MLSVTLERLLSNSLSIFLSFALALFLLSLLRHVTVIRALRVFTVYRTALLLAATGFCCCAAAAKAEQLFHVVYCVALCAYNSLATLIVIQSIFTTIYAIFSITKKYATKICIYQKKQ